MFIEKRLTEFRDVHAACRASAAKALDCSQTHEKGPRSVDLPTSGGSEPRRPRCPGIGCEHKGHPHPETEAPPTPYRTT